ncbi:putative neutral sphingomyelinase [Mya arenaria]|uniref:putative neutral sphingomyelinase n=1 Tax=Mya arenaria TaxID=6604 RepID=UPI0022E6A645|nr:putative neutral sphingomyelinase [Mya arenaria]
MAGQKQQKDIGLKILTLNCWGVPVPVVCKHRNERMPAIGDAVAKSDLDVAVFQEIWHKGDFDILKQRISKTLPYSHYFYSGSIGSGLCVFSKWPIGQTLYHRFDPNGYAHKVQHGDWFGGKGVGLAVITVGGVTLNVYITHIHAEYNRENDEYLAHRIAQAFSLSQFVKLTSLGADLSLVCGDLNLEPVDLGYRLILTNAGLGDCWLDKMTSDTSDKAGLTCDCPGNSYCPSKSAGKRIDYILYKAGNGVEATVSKCDVTMGRVPGKAFSYSDHEGVQAEITVKNSQNSIGPTPDPKTEVTPLLEESLGILDEGLTVTRSGTRFFTIFAVLCLLLAYIITVVHIPYPLDFFVGVFRVALILATGYGVVQTLVMIRSEVHGLEAAREDVKNLLQHLKS